MLDIKEYIKRDSLYFSNKTIYEIKKRIENLLVFPEMGRYIPEFDSKKSRELIYKSYRIIYYISSNDIYILRVLHHSQNILYFKSELFH